MGEIRERMTEQINQERGLQSKINGKREVKINKRVKE